jgi:hypothetical protein
VHVPIVPALATLLVVCSPTLLLSQVRGRVRCNLRTPRGFREDLDQMRSPSCTIAMPRSASAGASSRKDPVQCAAGITRRNAAAAVISESIGIPSHL